MCAAATLLDFDDPVEAASWFAVGDVVTGGVSLESSAGFAAAAGEWNDVRLPVSEFVATFRGSKVRLAPTLDAATVRVPGLVISDRQAGRFELRVDRIAIERWESAHALWTRSQVLLHCARALDLCVARSLRRAGPHHLKLRV